MSEKTARCLVAEVEIQKVPVKQEPEKRDAADGEESVPNLVPNPLLRVGQGFDGCDDRD
jgi:hypothetical protein